MIEEEDNISGNDTHMKLVNLMSKFRKIKHMDKFVGIKKSEFIMLITVDCTIAKCGTATVSQISSKMEMTNAAASKTIGELENKGYLEKKINKEDKRQSYIELTLKGKEKLKFLKAERDNITKSIFDKLGKEDTDKLFELMEKIYEVAEAEINIRIQSRKNEEKE